MKITLIKIATVEQTHAVPSIVLLSQNLLKCMITWHNILYSFHPHGFCMMKGSVCVCVCVCLCVLRYWYRPVCLTATTWHCCCMSSLLNISVSEQNKSQSCLSFYTHAHSYGQHQSISVCVCVCVCVQWMLSVCKRVDSRRIGASHFIVFMRMYTRRAYTALIQPVCDGIAWAHAYWLIRHFHTIR